jgi:hypothetical protein
VTLGTPHRSYDRGRSVRRDCTSGVAWPDSEGQSTYCWLYYLDCVVTASDDFHNIFRECAARWRSPRLGLVIVYAPAGTAVRLTFTCEAAKLLRLRTLSHTKMPSPPHLG